MRVLKEADRGEKRPVSVLHTVIWRELQWGSGVNKDKALNSNHDCGLGTSRLPRCMKGNRGISQGSSLRPGGRGREQLGGKMSWFHNCTFKCITMSVQHKDVSFEAQYNTEEFHSGYCADCTELWLNSIWWMNDWMNKRILTGVFVIWHEDSYILKMNYY